MAFNAPMQKRNKNYDDKFDDVMHYVELQLNEEGVRYKLKNKKDIQSLLEQFNDKATQRRRKNKHQYRKTMSDDFITKIMSSQHANDAVGKTIGAFGSLQTFEGQRNTLPPRADGREQYYTRQGGLAVKYVRNDQGRIIVRFRNEHGQYVSSKDVEQDES